MRCYSAVVEQYNLQSSLFISIPYIKLQWHL